MFRIRNLVCSYKAGQTVLQIPELTIPLNEVVFIVGLSGSGKSTLLETLGLMNNTLQPGSGVELCMDESLKYDYYYIWNKGDSFSRSEIRKRNFSFVFQQNNLMNNFTALENICLGQMIQGISFRDALDRAKFYLKKLDLLEIDHTKLCQELSGGEKQRIAFIRALATNSPVIFGDEPTGNLDARNADILFSLLRETTKTHSRSAIIVSHDIEMAQKYADRIIALEKDADTFTVRKNSSYIKTGKSFKNEEARDFDFNQLLKNQKQ